MIHELLTLLFFLSTLSTLWLVKKITPQIRLLELPTTKKINLTAPYIRESIFD